MAPEEAAVALDRLQVARPELWDAPRREGCLRGIDVYTTVRLVRAFAVACEDFGIAHGRLPALVKPRTTADHWFLMKFFHDIPMRPANPADKLAGPYFISEETLERVAFPQRPWVSQRPELPEDDAVPPGLYWLKASLGCSMQVRLRWPLKPDIRALLQEKAEGWFATPYGYRWGEWWYSLSRQHLFLEKDVSHLRDGRPEIKIFLRDGQPKLFYAIRLNPGGPHEQAYYDGDLNRLEGHSPGNLPLKDELPENIGLMLQAASEIGRDFRNCRIDFLNLKGPRPGFGEITICHNNARKMLEPPELDELARELLFE